MAEYSCAYWAYKALPDATTLTSVELAVPGCSPTQSRYTRSERTMLGQSPPVFTNGGGEAAAAGPVGTALVVDGIGS
jgi:hypothetical protein